jgi:lysozyme
MSLVDSITTQLRRDEGEKLSVYQDHLGFWTIGIGHLVDARKGGRISPRISQLIFEEDLRDKMAELNRTLPWWLKLDEARQGVLLNMAFQLGVGGLLKFGRTLLAIESGRYADAATYMLDSLWAQQTPERARRLAEQMRTGVWQ